MQNLHLAKNNWLINDSKAQNRSVDGVDVVKFAKTEVKSGPVAKRLRMSKLESVYFFKRHKIHPSFCIGHLGH